MAMMIPKVSVITVTYNALDGLRRTVKSVIGQQFDNYEFIVVDGAGADGTADYLRAEATGVTRWVSEPDGGIYEAMNKGVRMAQGEYCIFMNAGDCFVDDGVLASVFPFLDGTDLVIGNQIHVNEQGMMDDYTPAKGSFNLTNLLQSAVKHQSTFIRRSVLISHPYDESLRLVSDWKFFLELFLEGAVSYKTVDVNVCFFFGGGATDKNRELGKKERLDVLSAYPEFKSIWESPYRPSFTKKSRNKLLFFLNRIRYTQKLKKLK